jgi:hypothetical protein
VWHQREARKLIQLKGMLDAIFYQHTHVIESMKARSLRGILFNRLWENLLRSSAFSAT